MVKFDGKLLLNVKYIGNIYTLTVMSMTDI